MCDCVHVLTESNFGYRMDGKEWLMTWKWIRFAEIANVPYSRMGMEYFC